MRRTAALLCTSVTSVNQLRKRFGFEGTLIELKNSRSRQTIRAQAASLTTSLVALPDVLKRFRQSLLLHSAIRVTGVAREDKLVVIALAASARAMISFAATQS